MESLLLTEVINANEGRDVAVYNIPGAYLILYMEEEVIIILEEIMEELM